MNLLKAALSVILSAVVSQAGAAVVVGSLSREVDSDLIVDTMNGRDWLGWDVTRGLTYQQTLAETQFGGRFSGFTVAGAVDAHKFVEAMIGSSPCSVYNNAQCFFQENKDLENLVGESLYDSRLQFGSAGDADMVLFVNDLNGYWPVGFIQIITSATGEPDAVIKANNWSSFAAADSLALSPSESVGWLLFRESATSVPEPAPLMLVLFGLAISGALSLRRR